MHSMVGSSSGSGGKSFYSKSTSIESLDINQLSIIDLNKASNKYSGYGKKLPSIKKKSGRKNINKLNIDLASSPLHYKKMGYSLNSEFMDNLYSPGFSASTQLDSSKHANFYNSNSTGATSGKTEIDDAYNINSSINGNYFDSLNSSSTTVKKVKSSDLPQNHCDSFSISKNHSLTTRQSSCSPEFGYTLNLSESKFSDKHVGFISDSTIFAYGSTSSGNSYTSPLMPPQSLASSDSKLVNSRSQVYINNCSEINREYVKPSSNSNIHIGGGCTNMDNIHLAPGAKKIDSSQYSKSNSNNYNFDKKPSSNFNPSIHISDSTRTKSQVYEKELTKVADYSNRKITNQNNLFQQISRNDLSSDSRRNIDQYFNFDKETNKFTSVCPDNVYCKPGYAYSNVAKIQTDEASSDSDSFNYVSEDTPNLNLKSGGRNFTELTKNNTSNCEIHIDDISDIENDHEAIHSIPKLLKNSCFDLSQIETENLPKNEVYYYINNSDVNINQVGDSESENLYGSKLHNSQFIESKQVKAAPPVSASSILNDPVNIGNKKSLQSTTAKNHKNIPSPQDNFSYLIQNKQYQHAETIKQSPEFGKKINDKRIDLHFASQGANYEINKYGSRGSNLSISPEYNFNEITKVVNDPDYANFSRYYCSKKSNNAKLTFLNFLKSSSIGDEMFDNESVSTVDSFSQELGVLGISSATDNHVVSNNKRDSSSSTDTKNASKTSFYNKPLPTKPKSKKQMHF
ncbi:hypothetical protein AYI70_g9798 [Smittium culicis]|uniref:Uncharacterized protein n=1 Tax=Smittium culicis TaxID=133412 RepID=A0A1R1X9N7_9FUNG|nr:hypothetical protein AYI70_g9798 [Smittium culicis]